MHDNMIAKLKIVAGSWLDPTAGQTKRVSLLENASLSEVLTISQTKQSNSPL
jgi:hypothetical protein